VVSALALNFFPDPVGALREMARVVAPGGAVAIYVWDYAAGMEMLRIFWDVAVALDPAAQPLDEKVRFPICAPAALEEAFAAAGLAVEDVTSLTAPTHFASFDDYWQPFLGAVGPAAGYVAALRPDEKAALVTALRAALPIQPDGSIPLRATAWAICARTRGEIIGE
jgi:SAM-dependent methyltransferase